MREAVVALVLLGGVLVSVLAVLRLLAQRRAQDRLENSLRDEAEPAAAPIARRLVRRWWWVSFVLAAIVFGSLWGFTGWPWTYCSAFAVLAGLLSWQAESMLHQQLLHRCEQQLADVIDMLVAAVKAGSTLQSALESAAESSGRPFRPQLEEVIRRVRYGADATAALSDLTERVPLETVRLFATSLAVNWQVGGRLAQTLANVGRTIRDRIEISRRITAMTMQSRLSVVSVMGVTYFIAALMWRNDPERMAGFLRSMVGQYLVAIALVLQGVGIVWISRLSQPKF